MNIIILAGCVALYGVNRAFLKGLLGWPFLRCYLSDVLAGPVMLAYTNVLFIAVRKEEHSLRSLPMILAFMLIASVFWEFVTPLFRKGSVTDYGDIAAYMIGGLTYWVVTRVAEAKPGQGA